MYCDVLIYLRENSIGTDEDNDDDEDDDDDDDDDDDTLEIFTTIGSAKSVLAGEKLVAT